MSKIYKTGGVWNDGQIKFQVMLKKFSLSILSFSSFDKKTKQISKLVLTEQEASESLFSKSSICHSQKSDHTHFYLDMFEKC